MKKYARQCDVTGEGMNAGFCIGDGAMYIKSEKHMSEHITNDTDTNIRSIDLVHDIAGILANDEHFLPRL